MSRRSHAGRTRHGQPGRGHRDGNRPSPASERPAAHRPASPRPAPPTPTAIDPPAHASGSPAPAGQGAPLEALRRPTPDPRPIPSGQPAAPTSTDDPALIRSAPPATLAVDPAPTMMRAEPLPAQRPSPAGVPLNGDPGCTAPQLRRFIKSRAYVPMHELRRRFGINGTDDDVTQVSLERGNVYVGLPYREGRLLGELLRAGDVGFELSLDPETPVVVGVYPMRPVPRS